MYRLVIALLALLITSISSDISKAQPTSDDPVQYWYVSYNSVDWQRIDSLRAFWKQISVLPEQQKKNGEILDWRGLIHHTGNEHNVITMTKYPSWKAIHDTSAINATVRAVFPDSAQLAALSASGSWIFGANPHQDDIFVEGAGSKLSASGASSEDTFWYASFYEVPWARVDSLTKLWEMTAQVTDEAIRNGSILGRLRLLHHTGAQAANVVELQQYPSWEALEYRSFGGAQRAVIPDSTKRAAINSGYGYVFDGAPHYDGIYIEPGN